MSIELPEKDLQDALEIGIAGAKNIIAQEIEQSIVSAFSYQVPEYQ